MELKSKIGPITAIVITGSIVFWMVSGGNGITVANAGTPETNSTEKEVSTLASESKLIKKVQAKTIIAKSIATTLSLSGTTHVSDSLTLLSGNAGRIDKIFFEKGDFVTKGSVILQTDTRSLQSDIEQAKALLAQKTLELEGTQRLIKQKLTSAVALASIKTEVAQARATLKRLQIDLENASLIAPFSGILNTLVVTETQLLQAGALVGELVAVDPLVISTNIPQKEAHKITLGGSANIIINGDAVTGSINYINSVADSGTRSINVEIEIPNENNELPAGITTEVNLSLPETMAHGFSPALLTLDENGHTAIKILDIDNRVVVTPVTIIKSTREKVWVTGLSKNINIITVGQGFTEAGDTVEATFTN
ncbi:efflux RND transporter periplasmic adaptor subunit [Marinomonas sp. 15G1-11]|uniref:Efflux RND transporter periplasmic adaptor subunit n=1 Tax=Marinomonas phaeophyticola TaxID=3004091 RepID=A0ABT4JPT2_9GAMM|nr:efflux RND transporter periplasmic adaptor subunit [Marinomonas sp. 15G1-11]MCZ2720369.1 efflux RND transporter periplasmic adaptor subunit [Marinomonas sp. 15G1-11]